MPSVWKRSWNHFWRIRIAYLVLLITLTTTTLVFLYLRGSSRTHDQLRFERLVIRAQNNIDYRITRCVDQMYNLRALFAVTPTVSRDESGVGPPVPRLFRDAYSAAS